MAARRDRHAPGRPERAAALRHRSAVAHRHPRPLCGAGPLCSTYPDGYQYDTGRGSHPKSATFPPQKGHGSTPMTATSIRYTSDSKQHIEGKLAYFSILMGGMLYNQANTACHLTDCMLHAKSHTLITTGTIAMHTRIAIRNTPSCYVPRVICCLCATCYGMAWQGMVRFRTGQTERHGAARRDRTWQVTARDETARDGT